MTNEDAREAALIAAYRTLGPNGKQTLWSLAERLRVGAEQYKADFDEPRDWAQMAIEEALDLAVYLVQFRKLAP